MTRLVRLLALILTVSCCFHSCSRAAMDFTVSLARIDQQNSDVSADFIIRTYAVAGTSADRLKVLQRALRYQPSTALAIAQGACSEPQSEPVALVLFDILLDNGDLENAYRLWTVSLEASDHPELLEELVLLAFEQNPRVILFMDLGKMANAAVATGNGTMLLGLANYALLDGAKTLAAMFATEAARLGSLVPARLLWDLGLDELLLSQSTATINPDDCFLAAGAAVRLQRYESALGCLERASPLQGSTFPYGSRRLRESLAYVHYQLARQRLHQKSLPMDTALDLLSAESIYRDLIQDYPDDPALMESLGASLLLIEDITSFASLSGSYSLGNPDQALQLLAASFLTHGPDGSMQLARKLQSSFDSDRVRQALAVYYLATGSYQDLVDLGDISDLPLADLLGGYICVFKREYPEALTRLLREDHFPDAPLVPFNIALLFLKLGQYRSALEMFALAATRAENASLPREQSMALLWMARIRDWLGESEQAENLARSALSCWPDNGQATLFLLQLLQ